MMDTKEKGRALACHLRSLPDFVLVPGTVYDHMGAILVDALLQAGTNYDGVRARAKLVLGHPEARTTSGFLGLLAKTPIHSLLQWKGRKPLWVQGAADFFQKEGVETKQDLKQWLEKAGNAQRLFTLSGINAKTADYLKKLAGIPNTAMDRHWYTCLDAAGIPFEGYDEAKRIADCAAEEMNVDKSVLDTSVWRYERSTKQQGRC